MKNATPSEQRKTILLEEVDSLETEKVAQKYRKMAGIQDESFEYLVIELGLELRNEAVEELLQKDKIAKAFHLFCKSLVKKYPQHSSLISEKEWKYAIAEIFFFGEIQTDTRKELNFSRVFWTETSEKALLIKILPSATKKEIADFLNSPINNLDRKFREKGIKSISPKKRNRENNTSALDLWVRVLNNFSSDEISNTFQKKFPQEYKETFNRKTNYRLKYELIAHYLFHRFNLKSPKGGPYKADYVKAIIEKAKKNKTQIKNGLIKKIP